MIKLICKNCNNIPDVAGERIIYGCVTCNKNSHNVFKNKIFEELKKNEIN